ncbi:hypothetical protein D9M72_313510 [compost metagenome]
MRQAHRAFLRGHALDGRDRVFHQRVERNRRIGDAVHERGVGAVLQQPPHQVGQQRLVRAHRRVDAAGPPERAHHLLVQRLAHAVQALELVLARRVARRVGHRVDRGQRVGVVRGELRVHRVGRIEQPARAREVRHVGVGLARVDRVARQPVELRALDLAVPVGALHEPHHEPVAAAAREVDHPVDHEGAALLVALHHEADALPARQRGLEAQALQQVERELEPVGFFGVDVQADVVVQRQQRQVAQHRVQLGHHARVLRAAVARVQRRQLDRDARPAVHAAPVRGTADGVDRVFVGGAVAACVVGRERGLAEHVVRIAKALRLERARMRQRLADGFAGDELLAHHAHRHVHALADQRLAALADQPRERGRQARLAVRGHQLAREQQAPGGGVDEHRRAVPRVRLPLTLRDLVADERVARVGVGNAQQRLGQAHQRHAFLRRQRVLLQQALHQARAAAAVFALAQLVGDAMGEGVGFGGLVGRQPRLREQRLQCLRFGRPAGGRDAGAQRGRRGGAVGEGDEGRGQGGGIVGAHGASVVVMCWMISAIGMNISPKNIHFDEQVSADWTAGFQPGVD